MRRGRAPCCAKVGLNRGSWTPEEDMRLIAYVRKYGHANWRALPKQAGLLRCGKSCRLRWINYLRPDLKRGNFTAEEEETIIKLHGLLGNKWSKIASCLPGRTDNEIKNVWHTHLKKKLGQREQQKAGAKNNDKTTWVDEPATSPSSSMTTNCSSGDVGEQCNGSKEPDKIEITALDPDIDIFDMLPDAITTGACPAAPMPTSPCSSSSLSTRVPGVEELLELPEIDIEPNIWSIVDGDSAAAAADVGVRHVGACGGDATVPRTATTTNTRQEEGKEWWLENLERELGLWGPTEDYQDLAAPLADMQWDPVSSYFQAGPTAAAFQPPGSSPVLL